MVKVCRICGQPIPRDPRNRTFQRRIYCSEKCARKGRQKRLRKHVKHLDFSRGIVWIYDVDKNIMTMEDRG